jgi:hypothetical protein
MRKIVILGLITLIFTSCNSSTNQKIDKKEESSKLEISNSDKSIDFKDIVINGARDTSEIIKIKDNCVFIIQMTTNESDSLENADPDSYEVFSENANNAAMNASDLLDRLNIKSIWSDKRYIDCEFNGKNYLLDTRLKNIAGDYCIMFMNDKKTKLIEIELLSEDILIDYFK